MTQNDINQFAAQMQACADKLAAALKKDEPNEETHYKLNGVWIKRTYPRSYRPTLQTAAKGQDLKAIGKALDALDA